MGKWQETYNFNRKPFLIQLLSVLFLSLIVGGGVISLLYPTIGHSHASAPKYYVHFSQQYFAGQILSASLDSDKDPHHVTYSILNGTQLYYGIDSTSTPPGQRPGIANPGNDPVSDAYYNTFKVIAPASLYSAVTLNGQYNFNELKLLSSFTGPNQQLQLTISPFTANAVMMDTIMLIPKLIDQNVSQNMIKAAGDAKILAQVMAIADKMKDLILMDNDFKQIVHAYPNWNKVLKYSIYFAHDVYNLFQSKSEIDKLGELLYIVLGKVVTENVLHTKIEKYLTTFLLIVKQADLAATVFGFIRDEILAIGSMLILQYPPTVTIQTIALPSPSPTTTSTVLSSPSPPVQTVYYNTGTSITAYNTANGQQKWSLGSSKSDIVGDLVLTTLSNQPALLYVDNGTLHAVNPTSGSDLGITYSLNTFSLTAPPIISNGVIYISSDDSTGPHMNGFSMSCSASCSPLWTVPMQSGLCHAPTISNNTLYVAECDVYIQAFDLTQNLPTLKWTYRINGSISTPIIADANGVIYFGWNYWPRSGWVNAIQPVYNGSTGIWNFNQLWNYQLTGTPNSLEFSNNILYFTSSCWSGTPNSGSSCGTNLDALYSVDGSTVWPEVNVPVSANFNGAGVFLANKSLYFGTTDGIYSVDATIGNQKWHVLSGVNGTFFTPLVIGNQIFVDSNMGLYDLNASDGSQQMQFSTVPALSNQFQGLAVDFTGN